MAIEGRTALSIFPVGLKVRHKEEKSKQVTGETGEILARVGQLKSTHSHFSFSFFFFFFFFQKTQGH
jgi:hypothetical protein